MTFSFRAFSRMTSKSIYSSYSDSSEFFYNQSVFFILKKSSSFSNSSKFVFFAYIMHDFLESIFFYQRISLIDNWSYQYFIVSKMKDVELFMIENTRFDKRNRQIVDCFYCHFVVFVDKWHYINFLQVHFDACSNCSCV